AYLSKPIGPAEFHATIDRVVGAKRPSSSANLENYDEELVDFPRILASCGGDAGLLSKMIDSFKSQAQKHLERLWDAIDREDSVALSQRAHKFSGLVSAFSASGTEELAILQELGGKRDLAGAAEHYQKLANIVEHLSRLLPRLANVSVAGG